MRYINLVFIYLLYLFTYEKTKMIGCRRDCVVYRAVTADEDILRPIIPRLGN